MSGYFAGSVLTGSFGGSGSRIDSLNPRIPSPRPLPSPASFCGPKRNNAAMTITSRCIGCSAPSNIFILHHFIVRRRSGWSLFGAERIRPQFLFDLLDHFGAPSVVQIVLQPPQGDAHQVAMMQTRANLLRFAEVQPDIVKQVYIFRPQPWWMGSQVHES